MPHDDKPSTSLNVFLDNTVKLLNNERAAEVAQIDALLTSRSLHELCGSGHALRRLHIVAQRRTPFGYVLTLARDQSVDDARALPDHKFSSGDTVSIAHSTSYRTSLGDGVVCKCTQQSVDVALHKKDINLSAWKIDAHTFAIVRSVNDVTHRRLMACVSSLKDYKLCPGAPLVDYCFHERRLPLCTNDPELHFFDTTLNISQQDSVRFACNVQRPLAFIHGPPGTGKTQTVVEIIRQAIARGWRTLVTAPSNVAVDNVLSRCAQHADVKAVKLCRLGHAARTHEENIKYTLDALLAASEQQQLAQDAKAELKSASSTRGQRGAVRELRQEAREREERAVQETLNACGVVFATLTMCSSSQYPLKHSKRQFDLVIVDECAQAIEIACWLAILQAQKAVLAGDHQQLPPTLFCESNERLSCVTLMARIDAELNNEHDSLFRLLDIQYRMHESIMLWSSERFYNGRLKAHESVRAHTLSQFATSECEEKHSRLCPLVMIDTQHCDDDFTELRCVDDESKANAGEVTAVWAQLRLLIDQYGIKQESIAVISPYNLQVQFLRQYVGVIYPRVAIRSVDGFQGQEREAIILTLVRSNKQCIVGFLSDHRRLNVALTRARRHLCIVADARTVGTGDNEHCRALIAHMQTHANVIDACSDMHEELAMVPFTVDLSSYAIEEPTVSVSLLNNAKKNEAENKKKKKSTKVPQSASTVASAANDVVVEISEETLIDIDRQFKDEILTQLSNFLNDESRTELQLSSLLTSRQRALVHELCESLELTHVSHTDDDGMRRLLVGKCTPTTEIEASKSKPKPKKTQQSKETPRTDKPKLSARKEKPADKVAQKLDKHDDDDEALLDAIIKAQQHCSYEKCKRLVGTVHIDCCHCKRRFCLEHAQAEVHGCGEAAKIAARKACKEGYERPNEKKLSDIERARLLKKLHEKQHKQRPQGKAQTKKK